MGTNRSWLAALIVGLALATTASCHSRGGDHPLPRPVVVIGVDGLEWRLVQKLSGEGRLPELTRLVHDGVAVRLTTLEPAISPPIWTSMATGVTPEVHGILGFVRPDLQGPSGEPVLFTNRERRVKAVWNIAGDAGLSTCTIGYWMTFPVEDVRGVMVAQTGTPPGSVVAVRKGALQEGRSGQVFPPAMEETVFSLARESAADAATRERELFGDTAAWAQPMKRIVEHSRWSVAADSAYQRIALELVGERDRCNVTIVYLGLADVLGHRFWRWSWPGDFPSSPPQQEIDAYGDVLARAYGQIDAFLGAMRRSAGEDAAVIVVSDHGMGPFRPGAAFDLARDDAPLLRSGGHSAKRDAFLAGAGPGLRTSGGNLTHLAKVGSILDFAPTILALLGLPRGGDMAGHAPDGLLDPAFALAHPVHEIPSHTPAGWNSTRHLAEAAADGERMEQLRGLGYLE